MQPIQTHNLTEFIKQKLKCGEDEAVEFICDFYDNEALGIAQTWLNEFCEYFPDDFDIKNPILIEIGEQIKRGNLRYKNVESLFKSRFPDLFADKETKNTIFNGMLLVPHLKDTADPTSKMCNAVLCKVVLYNDDYIYLENQIDHKMYIISVEDFEKN